MALPTAKRSTPTLVHHLHGAQDDVSEALWFEDGYKQVIGYLTEGRYLVFEKAGKALTNTGDGSRLSATPAVSDHSKKEQRWVIHYSSGEESQLFKISSALDGKWIGPRGVLLPANKRDLAAEIKITFRGNGKGYSLQYANSGNFSIVEQSMGLNGTSGYQVWSVTYHS